MFRRYMSADGEGESPTRQNRASRVHDARDAYRKRIGFDLHVR